MAFGYYDYKGKRHWMGVGNVRSAQWLERNNPGKLEEFLNRNTVRQTKIEVTEFRHPREQSFAAKQAPGFRGLPKDERKPPSNEPGSGNSPEEIDEVVSGLEAKPSADSMLPGLKIS